MATDSSGTLTDDGKLLFGAGFVFGVMATILLVGVVVAVLAANGSPVPSTLLFTVLAGVVFTGIVGGGLYLLAFPENRTKVAVEPAAFGFDDEE